MLQVEDHCAAVRSCCATVPHHPCKRRLRCAFQTMIGSSSPAGGPGPPAALFEPPEGPAPPPDRLLVPADIRRDTSLVVVVVVEELPPLDDRPSLPIPLLSFACRFAELMEELEADVDVAPEPDPDGEAAMVAPGVIGSADDACISIRWLVDACVEPDAEPDTVEPWWLTS